MTRADWQADESVVGMFLNGSEMVAPGPHGETVEDDSFLLLFNGHHEDRRLSGPQPPLRQALGARADDRRSGLRRPGAPSTRRAAT